MRTTLETIACIESIIDDLHRNENSEDGRKYYQDLIDEVRNLRSSIATLAEAANEAYLTFDAALLFAPKTPEFEHVRFVNDSLNKAIVTLAMGHGNGR
jgi:hypothetical protein